jgi:two-component system, OmpR family, sensor kinase
VSRVPLRLRLSLAFVAAMAVVLAVVGTLLYVRLGDSLLEQVDEALETVAAGGVEAAPLEDGFVRVFDPPGTVLTTSRGVDPPALTDVDLSRAADGAYFLTRDSMRMHLAPAGSNVVVAGASLEDRQEALDGLLAELFVVGPLALLLSGIAGYLLAGAALRPVEAMRRQAAQISSERAGQRLPLPPARDEIRRLGETLNEMLGRLEAGLARERRFVADASHELRTPLALLQAELELAARRPRSREELDAALRSAREEVERLVRLAEDLLVLARSDDGRLPLALEPHIVGEVLDAVAGRYDSRAAGAGRSIEVAPGPDRVLTGDRLRLEQALGNLVDNALRHGAGTIRLEAVEIGPLLELRVADDGPGFAQEFLPHAFERFSRADVAREGGGAGLGLAIVEAIARAHGGSASASNRPGGGALVRVRLPGAATAHLALI